MPNYPISYYLAHAINFSGIRSAARILDSSELYALSEAMRQNFPKFFNKETKSCYIAIDSLGLIEGISSDFVHSLFYLEPGDLAPEYIKIIEDSSNELETEIGYITLSPKTLDIPKDDYHARTVWPFEQAIINIGAKKFNLQKIEETSRRIMQFLDTDPEIFIFQDDEFKKAGCDPQLWTVAAKNYFNSSAEMLQVPPALAPAYVSASPQSENL
jgi:glycogen debranching enzyme